MKSRVELSVNERACHHADGWLAEIPESDLSERSARFGAYRKIFLVVAGIALLASQFADEGARSMGPSVGPSVVQMMQALSGMNDKTFRLTGILAGKAP